MHYKLSSAKITHCGASDIGLKRSTNEDYFKIIPEQDLLILADGMGGHNSGDVASKMAVELTAELIQNSIIETSNQFAIKLEEIIKSVNEKIFEFSKTSETLSGMGTTLCLLKFIDDIAICCNIGDSRIYRFRNHKLQLLTEDDSLINDLIHAGTLSKEQSRIFKHKNVITKAIGVSQEVSPTISVHYIEKGDSYILCSDGLTDYVSNIEISNILNDAIIMDQALYSLIDAANSAGGHDNITVLISSVL